MKSIHPPDTRLFVATSKEEMSEALHVLVDTLQGGDSGFVVYTGNTCSYLLELKRIPFDAGRKGTIDN
ncbi:hypothetical protein, partial [uncultured Chitinophaga sp.]|uniref:hypothetical protein n=1 Tax=uncultured Chitinophaga sp. TaxID=339340 RepID=UPI0025D3D505